MGVTHDVPGVDAHVAEKLGRRRETLGAEAARVLLATRRRGGADAFAAATLLQFGLRFLALPSVHCLRGTLR